MPACFSRDPSGRYWLVLDGLFETGSRKLLHRERNPGLYRSGSKMVNGGRAAYCTTHRDHFDRRSNDIDIGRGTTISLNVEKFRYDRVSDR